MKKLITFFLVSAISLAAYAQQAVDMGLSVKWASCNVGASSAEQPGDHYAWGETAPKTVYSWKNYAFYDESVDSKTEYHISKYSRSADYGAFDKKKILEPMDDVATVKLGGKWRMPTDDEWHELKKNCVCSWTKRNGKPGYLLTSKKNGNSIFLPAAGYRNSDEHVGKDSIGSYWSSSLGLSWATSPGIVRFGSVRFMDGIRSDRYIGLSVRAVCEY